MSLLIHQDNKKQLETLGYCKLTDFLNLRNQYSLSQLVKNYLKDIDYNSYGLYSSHNKNRVEESIALNNQIHDIIKSSLDVFFSDYKYFISHINIKPANSNYQFDLHQDWSIVDETQFESVQIWIPLVNTNELNGGIFFLPRSHQFFNNLRSGSLGLPIIKLSNKLKPYIKSIQVELGNAVCFYNKTFHGTFANNSEADRPVVVINIVSKNAKTFYFSKTEKKDTFDAYDLDYKELLTYLPKLEKGSTEMLRYNYSFIKPIVSNEDITESLLIKSSKKQMSFWNKFFSS